MPSIGKLRRQLDRLRIARRRRERALEAQRYAQRIAEQVLTNFTNYCQTFIRATDQAWRDVTAKVLGTGVRNG
jgi:uncharacterized protein YaaW (UPF0174 family)